MEKYIFYILSFLLGAWLSILIYIRVAPAPVIPPCPDCNCPALVSIGSDLADFKGKAKIKNFNQEVSLIGTEIYVVPDTSKNFKR